VRVPRFWRVRSVAGTKALRLPEVWLAFVAPACVALASDLRSYCAAAASASPEAGTAMGLAAEIALRSCHIHSINSASCLIIGPAYDNHYLEVKLGRMTVDEDQ
jgi:hypothetical protein